MTIMPKKFLVVVDIEDEIDFAKVQIIIGSRPAIRRLYLWLDTEEDANFVCNETLVDAQLPALLPVKSDP